MNNRKSQRTARSQTAAKQQKSESQEPRDLYVSMLNEMLSSEKQILALLPKLENLAGAPELKTSISEHLKETEGHRTA